MANLNATKVTSAGVAVTAVNASSGGDTIPYGARGRIANGDESATTVTVATPGTVDGLAIADRDINIPAGGAGFVKPTVAYRDPETNRVSLTYSSVTSLTLEDFE